MFALHKSCVVFQTAILSCYPRPNLRTLVNGNLSEALLRFGWGSKQKKKAFRNGVTGATYNTSHAGPTFTFKEADARRVDLWAKTGHCQPGGEEYGQDHTKRQIVHEKESRFK